MTSFSHQDAPQAFIILSEIDPDWKTALLESEIKVVKTSLMILVIKEMLLIDP